MKKFFKKLLYPLVKFVSNYIIRDHLYLSSLSLSATYISVEEIEGDYLEFGCYKGASFINAYRLINSASKEWTSSDRLAHAFSNAESAKEAFKKVKNLKRRFYAFDSFKGLPELEGIDKMHPRFVKGRYDCTEKVFKKNLLNADVNLEDVTIVPGFYDKTLNDKLKKDIGLNKAAIIMIDCDLYASTKIALDFITDLIDNGTIIIFDDWYSFKADPNLGEQKACNEWVEKNKNINLIPYGKYGHNFQMSFIVNKK